MFGRIGFFAALGLVFFSAGRTQPPSDVASPAELPSPPAAIDALLQRGRVTFRFGPRPAAERLADADPRADALPRKGSDADAGAGTASSSDAAAREPLRPPRDAETRYRFASVYRSRPQWVLRRVAGRRRLSIHITFTAVHLTPRHEVWMRQRPQTDRFWRDRLLLHELDHVRISSDPGIVKRFAQRLREHNQIETEIAANVAVDDRLVQRLVDQHVKSVFDEINDLVAIRYRELDRLTRNGRDPLPDGSSLERWLGADSGLPR